MSAVKRLEAERRYAFDVETALRRAGYSEGEKEAAMSRFGGFIFDRMRAGLSAAHTAEEIVRFDEEQSVIPRTRRADARPRGGRRTTETTEFLLGPGWRKQEAGPRETLYFNQRLGAVIRVRHQAWAQHRPVILEWPGGSKDFQWTADAAREAERLLGSSARSAPWR